MEKINKLYCPFCGEEMSADIHKEELEFADHWICNSKGRWECKVTGITTVYDRDDIKEWLDK